MTIYPTTYEQSSLKWGYYRHIFDKGDRNMRNSYLYDPAVEMDRIRERVARANEPGLIETFICWLIHKIKKNY